MNDPAKPFDAVAWMRAKREQLDEEIRRVGWEEADRRMLERLEGDPLYVRLKDRVVAPATLRSLALQKGAKDAAV